MTADQRVEWLQTLWANFQKKARTQRAMSSAEYWIASKWLDRNLPLAVVLRAVQDFEGQPRRLEALAQGVEKAVAYWHQSIGGLTELPLAGPLEEPR